MLTVATVVRLDALDAELTESIPPQQAEVLEVDIDLED